MLNHLEHRQQKLISRPAFLRRVLRYVLAALAVVFGSLAIGMVGYHVFEGLPWLDSFLNAAMILGGMGPVDQLHTPAGKFFAGAYALYAGLVFLLVAGLIFTPLVHRLLHHFHIER